MGITEQEAIKELQTRDEIFVAYSQATKLPYVICDQESFNDQVWVFATEEEIKAFGKKKLEDKILLMGMKYEKKDYPRFYGTLYAIGVNSVVWVDGENQIEVELTRIARQADFSQLEPKKQPLFNSTLQLSGIYFMQELRRPIKKEERTVNLREMEEELIVNLKKSEFLVAMATDPEDPTKVNIPYLKNKQGDILQPAFTDVMEFDKFARGKKLRAAKVPFAKLPGLIINQAKAFVINPMGFNLILDRVQLGKILGVEIPPAAAPAENAPAEAAAQETKACLLRKIGRDRGCMTPVLLFLGYSLFFTGRDKMVIEIDFQSDEALYTQLMNQIIMGIATSRLQEGDPLPSVRQLADTIGINMHTVNKAYSLLRQEGFVSIDRRKGAVICLDVDKLRAMEELKQNLRVALARGCCNNVTREEVHSLIDEIFDEYEK